MATNMLKNKNRTYSVVQ